MAVQWEIMNKNHDFPFASTGLPDHESGWQTSLLDLLFERMPMGIALLDRQFRIQRYNPTWGDFAARYAPLTGAPLAPGVGYFEHLPGAEAMILPLFERALAGEVVRENGVRLEAGGIVTHWNIVLAPLIESGETIGLLNIAVDATEQVKLQQNLEQLVEARTRELQVLLEVSAAANRSLRLEETLRITLDLIVSLVGASRAGVLLLDDKTGNLIPHTLRPEQTVAEEDLSVMIQAAQSALDSGEVVYIAPDLNRGLLEPGALIPLQMRGTKLGVLVIIGAVAGSFTQAQLALFQSIADQLSVAIQNARLFAEAENVAVAAERNRLARDLHDAVTQTLFSSSMIAEALPKIMERNPEEGRRRLEELRQLTRGALSEMRTLLVELRPAALVDTDLGDLIGHQVNAFIARTRLTVEYERNCVQNPPLEVKEAFYRIAQEAFNNIAKHAEASQVRVRLDCQPGLAELAIQDNGIGFDPQASHHEGLGMGIMKERARNIGAKFEIQSQLRGGTSLRIVWREATEA
jgi:signal transduction histidine kinase